MELLETLPLNTVLIAWALVLVICAVAVYAAINLMIDFPLSEEERNSDRMEKFVPCVVLEWTPVPNGRGYDPYRTECEWRVMLKDGTRVFCVAPINESLLRPNKRAHLEFERRKKFGVEYWAPVRVVR